MSTKRLGKGRIKAPLLWSIHRSYYAAPKMFKIFDSTAVDSSDDEDEMDYSSESQGGEIDW